MKLLLFENLDSGVMDGVSSDFLRSFSRANDEVCVRYVDHDSNFDAMLADVASFDAIAVCGGDGTAASVLYAARNTGVPVLIIPAGTANLLAMNLNYPTETPALAKLLREGRRMDFDICEIECGSIKLGFTLMAGCGYDWTIMHEAAAMKKQLGPLAYFHAAFSNPTPQVSKLRICLDGEWVEHEGVGVLLMNFSKIQGDINLAPNNNSPTDGTFDVMVMITNTALALLPTFAGAALDPSGKAVMESNALQYYRAREVRIEAEPPLCIQYDGEPLDISTPFTARILPGAARLIVSEESYERFNRLAKQDSPEI